MLAKQWRATAIMVMVALGGLLWSDHAASQGPTFKQRVALVTAFQNYNIVQYDEMIKALQNKGIPYEMVSTQLGMAQSGAHAVVIDHALTKLDLDRYAAIVFLGGFGALDDLVDNPQAIELIRRAAKQGKIVGGS